MNKIFLLSCITIIFISCARYENKEYYELEIGETVEIYASTNSCCFYCFPNKNNLTHTKFIELKTVDTGPNDCAGCNWTNSYVIKAKSVGIDTIILEQRVMIDSCSTPFEGQPEKYIINVK